MRSLLNKKLADFIPEGRIKSLDILRGLAIIAITVPHQTLLFDLQDTVIGHQLWLNGVYYTRPLFISVSGIAIVFFESKYRWPFRMIVHGSVLFLMAWFADVVSHQSIAIDWDIFQLIGACYAIAGLFSYLEQGGKKYIGILVLISIWSLFPALRPDHGLFPIWPQSVYFLGGYLIGKWGLSQYNRLWTVMLIVIICLLYLSCFYMYFERTFHLCTNPIGIGASLSAIFVLLILTLVLENNHLAEKFPSSFLLRFGQYPISLYYMQQFFVVYGLKMNFKLALTGVSNIDCTLHTSVLLLVMYFSTHLFERLKFLSIEFWLRRTESFIMNSVPQIGIFRPFSTK